MLSADNIDLYYGASHILRRVGISAERGKITCLLGRNGVGKTSLLRAIFGLQPIREGRVVWDGTGHHDAGHRGVPAHLADRHPAEGLGPGGGAVVPS